MSNATIADRAKSAIQQSGTKPGTFSGMKTADVQGILAKYTLAIQQALPNGGNPDRIIQAAVFQITTNPALAACTYQSVIGCVLNASLLGVSPHLKQCFFIPYRNNRAGTTEAQFQLSYTGLLSLARRSGQVKDVYAQVVRKGDKFSVQYGTEKRIEHVPDLDGGSERPMLYAYAVVTYLHGGNEFVVLDRAEIEKRRKKSRGQEANATGVWAEWEPEMWKKTALRSLLKTAPLSEEQFSALQTDGVAVTPDVFNRGEVRAEMIVHAEGEDGEVIVVEAADLQQIRDGVQDCVDLDALERYYKQNAAEWATRADVIEIFNQRKKELNNGNN